MLLGNKTHLVFGQWTHVVFGPPNSSRALVKTEKLSSHKMWALCHASYQVDPTPHVRTPVQGLLVYFIQVITFSHSSCIRHWLQFSSLNFMPVFWIVFSDLQKLQCCSKIRQGWSLIMTLLLQKQWLGVSFASGEQIIQACNDSSFDCSLSISLSCLIYQYLKAQVGLSSKWQA